MQSSSDIFFGINFYQDNSPQSDEKSKELQFLSKMKARRLSQINKEIVDISLGILEKVQIDFIVHASRHGEVNQSVAMIKDILNLKTPSPMIFSQSTHNTAVGQVSINKKIYVPTTAIAAGEQSFSMGLVAALNFLGQNQLSKVLFLYSDPKLDKIYQNKTNEINEMKLSAMVLSGEKQYMASFRQTEVSHREGELREFQDFYQEKSKKDACWRNLKICRV